VSDPINPEIEYVGSTTTGEPVNTRVLLSAVRISASAVAGVIETRAELVSEKFVSFVSETRILQLPLARFMVTAPDAGLILQAVVVLVSKTNVPLRFGTVPSPSDRLAVYVAVELLPYFKVAATDVVNVRGALLTVTVLVSYAAK
jgi:hypothetical protein